MEVESSLNWIKLLPDFPYDFFFSVPEEDGSSVSKPSSSNFCSTFAGLSFDICGMNVRKESDRSNTCTKHETIENVSVQEGILRTQAVLLVLIFLSLLNLL